jgi:hypothetical protein
MTHEKGEIMGDIGEPVRHVEFEPFPETAPIEEPAAPTPAPVETPAPEREPVPA